MFFGSNLYSRVLVDKQRYGVGLTNLDRHIVRAGERILRQAIGDRIRPTPIVHVFAEETTRVAPSGYDMAICLKA